MKWESIIRILELREILLSFKTGFNLVSAAVVRAILESISGLEPSSDTTEPRYLKLLSVCFDLLVDTTGVVCHQLSLLSTCLLYTSPSPRDAAQSRMPSSA